MKNRIVLIVDDEAAQCDNLKDILEDEGYIAYTAESCDEAMDVAKSSRPPVAILDLKLPDRPGTELLAELKALNPDMLCIMATAYADTDSAIKAVRHGAFHYLHKPLRPDDLLQVLDRAFDMIRLREEKAEAEAGRKQLLAQLLLRNEELESARNYIRNIIDSLPSVLLSVDSEGRIIEWNTEAEKEAGIAWEKVRGRFAGDIFPCISKQMKYLENVLEKGRHSRWEKLRIAGEGKNRYINITMIPLLTDRNKGAVIQIDDISLQLRLEEMMIQAEKMMSVGGLAAGIAHEINNPLGGILQSVQNIFRRTSDELSRNAETARSCGTDLAAVRCYMEQRNITGFLENIRESGSRASEIIRKVITFTRPSESRRAFLRLDELTERVLELAVHDYDLQKKYDFRNIEIVREFAPDLPEVPCTATEMEQVILNLIRNSAQALHGENPHPNPRIILRLAKEGKTVRMEVEDNGPGIDPAIVKRIFDPFFTTKEVGTGPGLGLSVSYYIITNNHKGTLTVESDPEKGTIFIIRLPLFRSMP